MSSPITIGSDRYQITWSDWWKYSVNGQDCKKRLMNLLLEVNDMLASIESGQYDNRDIFDCLEEIDDREYLCNSAISCYSDVSASGEIQQLQKELHTKTARLHQLKSRESFLLSTFERIGAIFGFSLAAGFEKGRQLAVLESREPSSVEELFEIENEKRRLLGEKGQIILCKKKEKITQGDIDKQKNKVDDLKRQLTETNQQLAETSQREKEAFSHMTDETEVVITVPPRTSTKIKDIKPYIEEHLETDKLRRKKNSLEYQVFSEEQNLIEIQAKFKRQEGGSLGFWGSIGNFFFGAKKDSSGVTIEGGVNINF